MYRIISKTYTRSQIAVKCLIVGTREVDAVFEHCKTDRLDAGTPTLLER
jgi:hypothetical protein